MYWHQFWVIYRYRRIKYGKYINAKAESTNPTVTVNLILPLQYSCGILFTYGRFCPELLWLRDFQIIPYILHHQKVPVWVQSCHPFHPFPSLWTEKRKKATMPIHHKTNHIWDRRRPERRGWGCINSNFGALFYSS